MRLCLASRYCSQSCAGVGRGLKVRDESRCVQVIFHYIGYNEQGRRVDSTYLKGAPARTRLGINGLIPGESSLRQPCGLHIKPRLCNYRPVLCVWTFPPGFEEGITSMRQGGKRRIVIPPDLGPPVSPFCLSAFLPFYLRLEWYRHVYFFGSYINSNNDIIYIYHIIYDNNAMQYWEVDANKKVFGVTT